MLNSTSLDEIMLKSRKPSKDVSASFIIFLDFVGRTGNIKVSVHVWDK